MSEQEVSVTKKLGRPRKSPTVVVRLPLETIAAAEAWAFSRGSNLTRAEAIQCLVSAGIDALKPAIRKASKIPPFGIGDRVIHAKFGEGVVTQIPIPTVSVGGPEGVVDSGWRCSVTWDDPSRKPSDIADFALSLKSKAD